MKGRGASAATRAAGVWGRSHEGTSLSDSSRGQVTRTAAEIYEEFFVPALFEEWPRRVAEAASLRPGQSVLDVACGTGVLARHAAERVGPAGRVVGLDVNEGMLAVGRRLVPALEWRQGPAEALPFADETFDAVVSQFGLMFFTDRVRALREMRRVLKPGGGLAVAVWDSLENTPGFAALAGLLRRLFGEEMARTLHAPFSLGDTEVLKALFAEAGIASPQVTTHEGTSRFPSLRDWIFTEVRGWTLSDNVGDAQYERLQSEAESELRAFVAPDGTVSFASPAHIVSARL